MVNNDKKINYQDQDVVNINIKNLFTTIVSEIDNYRSHRNINDISGSLTINNIDEIRAGDRYSPDYQESRCNAFYRMIGFPIVDKDNNFYSPGFDKNVNLDNDKYEKHIKIAGNLNKNVIKLLNDREDIYKKYSQIFSKQDINAVALNLANIYVRDFSDQILELNDPQAFSAQLFNVSSKNFIKTSVFQDKSSEITVDFKAKHIIKPFIVNPKIDFTVVPLKNLICKPFLSKNDAMISEADILRRPYIEKVIKTKYYNSSFKDETTDNLDKVIDDALNAITQNSSTLDDEKETIRAVLLQDLNKADLIILKKFLNIIRALVKSLISNIHIINNTNIKINFQPIPNNKFGPEYGLTLNDVDYGDTVRNKEIEKNIAELKNKKILADIQLKIGRKNNDLGKFSFANIDDIILGETHNIDDFYADQLDKLVKKRNKIGLDGINAFQEIEMLLGEFSGLGLIDIFVIQAALWGSDLSVLLGLIDDDAFKRYTSLISATNVNRLSVNDALKSFEKKAAEIYKIVQKYYTDPQFNQ